ncbi:MAG: dipeptidase PepE [Bacteroidales bacterium]|jgi:dipeptidase E|nr:dipeptidase PepE [Bacteroidales bacterium]
MKLLLISNSTNAGEAYLDYPKMDIRNFLGNSPVRALFVPYAAVSFSYDEYEARVENRFAEIGHHVVGIHRASDAVKAVEQAEAIVVGGGNTWKLVQMLQQNRLMDAIRKKVQTGTPYIGWSAGSNVACPTLRTTNDMPVVQPESFDTLNLVPFQINPHYTDAHPAGHGGETREDRIREFIELNPDVYVVGLREATMLRYEDGKLRLTGDRKARIFKKGFEPKELGAADDFSFLMQ